MTGKISQTNRVMKTILLCAATILASTSSALWESKPSNTLENTDKHVYDLSIGSHGSMRDEKTGRSYFEKLRIGLKNAEKKTEF